MQSGEAAARGTRQCREGQGRRKEERAKGKGKGEKERQEIAWSCAKAVSETSREAGERQEFFYVKGATEATGLFRP